jgi:hypothetical protein
MTTPRSRVLAILTVVAMLAIGTVAGIALDRGVLRRRSDQRGGRGGGPLGMMGEPADTATRNRMRARIVKRISDELALTAVQSHSVDSIFARHELQLDALRSRVGPQLDSLRNQMRVSIDSVLTPDQRVNFADQRRKFDARRKAGDGGGPPRN